MNQKGFIPIIVLVAVLVLAAIGGAYYLSTRHVINDRYATSPLPSPSLNAIASSTAQYVIPNFSQPASSSPVSSPQISAASTDEFDLTSPTNVELLVTDPSGQQTGYLLASKKEIEKIANSSYYTGGGIVDPAGTRPPMPDRRNYNEQNPTNGTYLLQVIGIQSGSYHVDVTLETGPQYKINNESVDGATTVNQIDSYQITLPSGKIQKLSS